MGIMAEANNFLQRVLPILRTLFLLLYASALLFWALTPLYILLSLSETLPDRLRFIDSLDNLQNTAIAWLIAFAILFLTLLCFVETSNGSDRDAQRVQCSLGLLCTLTLGLPSIGLSALPPRTASFDRALAENVNVDLSHERTPPRVHNAPTRYIIGIDLSKSFLGEGSPDRRSVIAQVINDIFLPKGLVGQSLRSSDILEVWVFGGNFQRLYDNYQHGNPSRGDVGLRNSLLAWAGGKALLTLDPRNYCWLSTDILSFLGAVRDNLSNDDYPYSSAKIILFSDLMQSLKLRPPAQCRNLTQISGRVELETAINRLAKDFKNLHDLSFVAFTANSAPETNEDDIEADFRVYFGSELRSLWQEVALSDWSSADEAGRLLMPGNLYSSEETRRLDLRYIRSPWLTPMESHLILPDTEDTNDLFLGLDAEKDSRIHLRFGGNSRDAFELSTEPGRKRYIKWSRLNTSPNPLPAEVECNGRKPDDTKSSTLLIGVPSQSKLYKLRLNYVSMVEPKSHEFTVLKNVLLALNMIPIILSIFMGLTVAKWFLLHRRASGASV